MADALDEAEQEVVDNIARCGWHCMRVASTADDPIQTVFAYTIGLEHSFGWPELICFGLGPDVLHACLANAIDECRRKAISPQAGLVLAEVLEQYPCRLDAFSVDHHSEHLGWAIWFARYQRRDPKAIRCLQLVWPDRDGRFPDDPACAKGARLLQQPVSS